MPVAIAVLIGLGPELAEAQGPAKVEIDNAWVRVSRVKLAPREILPRHTYPDSVVVYLTDVHQRLTSTPGNGLEITRKAGETAYLDAGERAEKNISDKPLEEVIVELKPGAPPLPPYPITLDPVKLAPQYHTVDFENDRVRILRTVLAPHIKSPLHEHPAYVVVYLTQLHTTMAISDGRQVDNIRHKGEIAWRDAMKHVTENIDNQTAMEIQVEIK